MMKEIAKLRDKYRLQLVKKYFKECEEAPEPYNTNVHVALHKSNSLSEVERLRLTIAKQEVEIDRLKGIIGIEDLM